MKGIRRLRRVSVVWGVMLLCNLMAPLPVRAEPTKIDTIAPSTVQSEGTLTLTFNEVINASTVKSVKIGNREATFLSPQATASKEFRVKVERDTPLGHQPVSVQVGEQKLPEQFVLVLPLVTGIRGQGTTIASAEVATRDEVAIQLSSPFPPGITPVVSIGNQNAIVKKLDNKQLVILVPEQLSRGDHKIRVSVEGVEMLTPPTLRVFPPPNATVTDISPKIVQAGTTVKVSGTDFFAPPEQITLLVGGVEVKTTRVAPDGTWFAAVMPAAVIPEDDTSERKGLKPGQKSIEVIILGVPAGLPERLQVKVQNPVSLGLTLTIVFVALAPLILVAWLIYWLYQAMRGSYPWIEALLVEQENQTYSLSRAQFYWWLVIIAYAYFFLFIARGFVEDTWSFPALSGFAYTFLISLGTVVLAQATSAMRGVKGAGQVHPARSDLIVHGGVIAPERVQQVVWSVLAGLGFLWITIRTYATATALPTIPEELLILMGISSAGYLAGKLGRKPGPIIKQVLVEEGSIRLKIYGEHLYRNAFIWVDGVQHPKDDIKTLEEDNPDRPNEFVKSFLVTLRDKSKEEWYGKEHTINIINADGQNARWQASFPKITSVTQSAAPAVQGRVTLEVKGSGIVPKAKLVVGDAPPDTEVKQDETDPNLWTILIEESWLGKEHQLEVTNPEGEKYTYVWKPPTGG